MQRFTSLICRLILEPLLKSAGVDKAIFVQTQHDVQENRWVLGLAEENSFLAGVVGWVDLASDACEDQLAEFKDHPKFVGIRHITQGETDDDFIIRPNVMAGLKVLERHGVPFELLFFTKHLKHAPKVASFVPELPLVIDHLSKPNIKERQFDDWAADLKAAAAATSKCVLQAFRDGHRSRLGELDSSRFAAVRRNCT